jgi:hypothetical protein
MTGEQITNEDVNRNVLEEALGQLRGKGIVMFDFSAMMLSATLPYVPVDVFEKACAFCLNKLSSNQPST